MQELAQAKLNLTLDVLGKREDGYHEMKMVMQSISLADQLTILPGQQPGIWVRSNFSFLPTGEKNLAAMAANRFYQALGRPAEDLEIRLEKHIPVCAGMAGGSSDAAAVLRALNRREGEPFTREQLVKIGERVGSDVPYCVLGGTALAEGRGEVLTPLPGLPFCWVVVCKPEFSVSTPELFARIDHCKVTRRPDTAGLIAALEAGDLAGVARRMYNVFEDVLPERQRARVAGIRQTLIDCGALGAAMSGTGPTAFGLFSDQGQAQAAAEQLRQEYRETYLAQTV